MAVTVGGTSITFNDGTVQSTAAGGFPSVTAGTNYQSSSPLGVSGFSTSMTAQVASRVFCSGTVRVSWRLTGAGDAYSTGYSYGRVYVNGVAVGPERNSPAPSMTLAFTDDVTVNPTALVAIYCRVQPGLAGGAAYLDGIGTANIPDRPIVVNWNSGLRS